MSKIVNEKSFCACDRSPSLLLRHMCEKQWTHIELTRRDCELFGTAIYRWPEQNELYSRKHNRLTICIRTNRALNVLRDCECVNWFHFSCWCWRVGDAPRGRFTGRRVCILVTDIHFRHWSVKMNVEEINYWSWMVDQTSRLSDTTQFHWNDKVVTAVEIC